MNICSALTCVWFKSGHKDADRDDEMQKWGWRRHDYDDDVGDDDNDDCDGDEYDDGDYDCDNDDHYDNNYNDCDD